MKVKLNGGPYHGVVLELANLVDQIGLGVDGVGKPDQNKPPVSHVIYNREKEVDGALLFELLGFKRRDGQPYTIEFVGGPGAGLHPAPRPAQFLDPTQCLPVLANGSLFRGVGKIAGEAIYELRNADGAWKFYFASVDRNPDRVQSLLTAESDRRLTQAIQHFYESPDYDIYSKPPTNEHPQVLVEVGLRRAHVDELIAPLIVAIWKMEMETLGSCQQIHAAESSTDKAYVAFPKQADARQFQAILTAAGISCTYEPKKMTIARKSDSGEVEEKLKFDTANVKFSCADIGRIELAQDFRIAAGGR